MITPSITQAVAQHPLNLSSEKVNPAVNKWNAEIYAEKADLQREIAKDIIQKRITPLGNKQKVLDIGCGDGALTEKLHDQTGAFVVGIDPSKEMIEYAMKHFADKAAFLNYDITHAFLPQYVNTFDLICTFNTLHWIFDQEMALKNVYALLSDHGTFIGQFFSPLTSQTLIYDNLQQLIKEEKWALYFERYEMPKQIVIKSIDEYRILLEKTGFHVQQCEIVQYEFQRTKEEIATNFRTWLPHLNALPSEDLKMNFTEELTQMILKKTKQDHLEKAKMILRPWVFQVTK